jgi:hypothetical protein
MASANITKSSASKFFALYNIPYTETATGGKITVNGTEKEWNWTPTDTCPPRAGVMALLRENVPAIVKDFGPGSKTPATTGGKVASGTVEKMLDPSYWDKHTPEQMESVRDLLAALIPARREAKKNAELAAAMETLKANGITDAKAVFGLFKNAPETVEAAPAPAPEAAPAPAVETPAAPAAKPKK